VTVDIYDMGNAQNAFGIYASERSPDNSFITLGAEGYTGRGRAQLPCRAPIT